MILDSCCLKVFSKIFGRTEKPSKDLGTARRSLRDEVPEGKFSSDS